MTSLRGKKGDQSSLPKRGRGRPRKALIQSKPLASSSDTDDFPGPDSESHIAPADLAQRSPEPTSSITHSSAVQAEFLSQTQDSVGDNPQSPNYFVAITSPKNTNKLIHQANSSIAFTDFEIRALNHFASLEMKADSMAQAYEENYLYTFEETFLSKNVDTIKSFINLTSFSPAPELILNRFIEENMIPDHFKRDC